MPSLAVLEPREIRELPDEQVSKLEQIRVAKDPFWLIEHGYLWIKTKDGELIPLELNPTQKKILAQIRQLMAEGKPARIWVLKARQTGVSTLCEAIIYCLTSMNANTNSFIIADDADGTDYLFEMSKLYHEKMKPSLRPALKRSNKKELVFLGTHSNIFIDTAGNEDAGRKYTFRYVHLSEVALYEQPESLFLGLNQAVPERPGTIIIGESTAKGVGNFFHREWEKAKKGETDWVAIFIAWFEDPEYRMKPPEDFQATPEERGMAARYELDNDQLYWRRWCIRNKCQGDPENFKQEYPCSDKEAFLSSGTGIFDKDALDWYSSQCKPPIAQGNLEPIEKKVEEGVKKMIALQPNPHGFLKVWEWPTEKGQYIIPADVAEGLVTGSYSAAPVISRENFRVVALWHGKIDPDLFGSRELWRLGKYYNNAVIGVERNNHGFTTLTALKNKHYTPMYYKEILDEKTMRKTKKFGWETNLKTKPLMIDELKRIIRDRILECWAEEFFKECYTYIELDDGSTEPESGCFADIVTSMAIGAQLYKRYPTPQEDKQPSYGFGKPKGISIRRAGMRRRRR
jgi:hypothetical protein